MSRMHTTATVFHRLPHGGHVDLNLSNDGRVLLLVNSAADVSQVLCELGAVRDELTEFHLAVTRDRQATAASPMRRDAA